MSIDFRDTPIRAVSEDIDGHTIYVGNGSGDLASFDMRTGILMFLLVLLSWELPELLIYLFCNASFDYASFMKDAFVFFHVFVFFWLFSSSLSIMSFPSIKIAKFVELTHSLVDL